MIIDEYFEKYPNNIIGFRVNTNNKIIDVWLNIDWVIPSDFNNDINVKKQKTDDKTGANYYMFYSEKLNFNELFKFVSNVIEHNLEVEKKQVLFKDKITELKDLFTKLSFEELKSIHFDVVPKFNDDVNLEHPIEIIKKEEEDVQSDGE
jgi:hypothetical protein